VSCSGRKVCCGRDVQLWVWTTAVGSLLGIPAVLHARCFLYRTDGSSLAFTPVNIGFSRRLKKNLTDT